MTVLVAAATTLWLAPDSAAADHRQITITGSAAYRERIALSPSATFEARLEELMGASAPPRSLARVRVKHPGRAPIAFELRCDRRRLDPRGRYVVRASVFEHGGLLFTGTRDYVFSEHGRGEDVAVLMRRPRVGPDGRAPDEGPRSLFYTRWRPVRIGDREVVLVGRQPEPWIELDPKALRVTGSAGCNRITGGFESTGDHLRFGALVTTRMACFSMETETRFLRALGQTRRYRVSGRTLELLDDGGRTLARLEERNLK
jgi:putative lipoprotein